MAEQIPYGIAGNLLTKLGSVAFHEIGLMYGIRSELRKLEYTLSTVRSVLLDADEKQEIIHAVADWVRRLNDVLYDADDLLDDFATEELRRRRNTDDRRRFAGQVTDFFRDKMAHRIKAIRESLDAVANHISSFNFIPARTVASDVPVRNNFGGREMCSVLEKSDKIVGRDEDKKQIIELLMQSSSRLESLSMVGIVGMGGLGKTTLAQLVCNDQRVASYFDLKMWVCVPDDFDVEILVSKVIESATNRDVEKLKLYQLQQLLGQNLYGKRYLLVLDDVWNEDLQKWGQFITLLPVGANGSKVLVTTRSTKVASVVGIDSPYVLKGLKDDESWELFRSLAFNADTNTNSNLVAIGKEIGKMCKGVPLVIKTLGRMLYFRTQESQWLSIRNNKNLVSLGDKNDFLSVLRLSYDNLPIHLKQCFAYCALFPRDYKIKKKMLVQLWMAQGYIQCSHENECLEDVGDEHFKELLSRSLFQEVEEKYTYHGDYYKMHDLIHDLAQSIVRSDIIILSDDVSDISERFRHVSSFGEVPLFVMPKYLMDNPIRTLFMERRIHCITNTFISSLKCTRVLRMRMRQQKLPKALGKLSHVRYLDLSRGSFENLPDGITRLKHLQTLKLNSCWELKELPRNTKKWINMRHLEIDECYKLTNMPGGLGELTQLQTLTRFPIGNEKDDRLSELKFLNNLRVQLVISGLSNARGSEAKEANLGGKQYLESLSLYWIGNEEATCTQQSEEEEEEEAVSVMESLQPHPNMKELLIEDYEGVRFPNWMMNDGLNLLLPNLISIRLSYCNRCQSLPPFNQLPSLKLLHLQHLKVVEYMMDYPLSAKPFFPSLKTLKIHNMPKLKGLGRRDVAAVEQAPLYPHLEELFLFRITTELCSHLISISSSLKSLEIWTMKDLISLPEGLQHVTTLQTLVIRFCSNMETLPDWIGLLTSLTKLSIYECPKLTSLPKALQSLRNLHTLDIYLCPYLFERCQKETGEDWPKISHIPHIMIDKEWMS